MAEQVSKTHEARKALFARGLRQGYLLLREVDEAFAPGALSAPERWLLLFSLRAANVRLLSDDGSVDAALQAGPA